MGQVAAAVQAHPHAAARRRAELAFSLASPLAESAGESFSRAAFQFLGFEQPELQHDFSDAGGFIGRSDFWWPGREGRKGVVGEFDGKAKYINPELRNGATAEEAVYNEKLREDRIRALGFGFARWGMGRRREPGEAAPEADRCRTAFGRPPTIACDESWIAFKPALFRPAPPLYCAAFKPGWESRWACGQSQSVRPARCPPPRRASRRTGRPP